MNEYTPEQAAALLKATVKRVVRLWKAPTGLSLSKAYRNAPMPPMPTDAELGLPYDAEGINTPDQHSYSATTGKRILPQATTAAQPAPHKPVLEGQPQAPKHIQLSPVMSRASTPPISALRPSVETGGSRQLDYSHLLTPEHRAAGYQLTVHPGAPKLSYTRSQFPVAKLTHNSQQVGELTGQIYRGKLMIGAAMVKEPHRGGKGVPMYEALMAHSRQNGAKTVQGDAHSSLAHAVHTKLAQKHGLDYHAEPTANQVSDPQLEHTGPNDNYWGKYKYAIKTEPQMSTLKSTAK